MRAKGFSIIELMVTLAILALLLTAVSPSLRDWVINSHIRNAASAFEQGIQLARQEAIRRNQSVSLWLVSTPSNASTALDDSCALSSSSGSWVVSVNSPVGKCTAAPSVNVDPMLVASHAVGDGGSGVTVAAVGADKATAATTVTFNGLGSIANADAAYRIDVSSTETATPRNLCVELSGVGSVRVCDPALASTDPRACKGVCKD